MLELVGLGSDPDAAAEVARRLGGSAYANHPSEKDTRPYSSMIRVATDDIEAVTAVSDVALHVAFPRTIKPLAGAAPEQRCIATFGMLANPAMTHRESDDHWRDNHGPLALRCHSAMCDYMQLSIVDTIAGQALDGIAMCAFPTRDDLSTRFFNDDAAKAEIIADVSKFASPKGSPARVVLIQTV